MSVLFVASVTLAFFCGYLAGIVTEGLWRVAGPDTEKEADRETDG